MGGIKRSEAALRASEAWSKRVLYSLAPNQREKSSCRAGPEAPPSGTNEPQPLGRGVQGDNDTFELQLVNLRGSGTKDDLKLQTVTIEGLVRSNNNFEPQSVVIEVLSESEEDVAEGVAVLSESEGDVAEGVAEVPSTPFLLLEAPALSDEGGANTGTVTLEELLRASTLCTSYQLNFCIDLDFFLPHVRKATRVVFITQHPIANLEAHSRNRKVSQHLVQNLGRFGTHHSKVMVNFHTGDRMEIVVTSANLQLLDMAASQSVWRSGMLCKGSKEGPTTFKHDFTRYLYRYNLPAARDLARALQPFDFSPVEVEFLSSAPGRYALGDTEVYGYAKLHQLLNRHRLFTEGPCQMVCQVSSIASAMSHKAAGTQTVFQHLLCPLSTHGSDFPLPPGAAALDRDQKRHGYQPVLVYPTTSDVSRSAIGYTAGQYLHFNPQASAPQRAQYELLRPIFARWASRKAKRESAPGHCKFYFVTQQQNHHTILRWCLMTSANLSKQAWGAPEPHEKWTRQTLSLASYEAGIFFPGASVPVFGRNTAPPGENLAGSKTMPSAVIRLPFDLPTQKYTPADQPWSINGSGIEADRYGHKYDPVRGLYGNGVGDG